MAEKETAPPSYDEVNPGQSNTGYAPPTGDPSGNPAQPGPYGYNPYPQQGGYLPQGGYPMQPVGQPYPPQYGMQGQNNATVVTHQPMMTTQQMVHQVPDQMSLAIFATLCCFWPVGIVAIMRASESRAALNRNDLLAARTLSEDARRLSLISMVIGIVVLVVIVVVVVVVVTQSPNYYYGY